MPVTGYSLREAIKKWELKRESVSKQWSNSLFSFDGEDKMPPDELMKAYIESDVAIAKLQTAQARYNLMVEVTVQSEKMTLSEAVKRVGGAGRSEKMWRTFASSTGRDKYDRTETSRSKDSEYAKRTITVKACIERAQKAAATAGALRGAIAESNSLKMEPTKLDLDPKLLE